MPSRRWLRRHRAVTLSVVVMVVVGCGKRDDPSRFVSAESSYSQAQEALRQRNYEQAIGLLDQALASGGLSPDFRGEALVQRAVCFVRAGRIKEAEADLQTAARGAPADLVESARSYLLEKSGRPSEALLAWKTARQINPSVVKFQD